MVIISLKLIHNMAKLLCKVPVRNNKVYKPLRNDKKYIKGNVKFYMCLLLQDTHPFSGNCIVL